MTFKILLLQKVVVYSLLNMSTCEKCLLIFCIKLAKYLGFPQLVSKILHNDHLSVRVFTVTPKSSYQLRDVYWNPGIESLKLFCNTAFWLILSQKNSLATRSLMELDCSRKVLRPRTFKLDVSQATPMLQAWWWTIYAWPLPFSCNKHKNLNPIPFPKSPTLFRTSLS